MTTRHERMRNLGEGYRLLLELATTALHMEVFRASLHEEIVAAATAVLIHYPSLADLSDGVTSGASKSHWLAGCCSVGDPFAQALRPSGMAPRSRAEAFVDAACLLIDLSHPISGPWKYRDLPPELVRQCHHVLRHFPSEYEVQAAARSSAPLNSWIQLEFLPPWWTWSGNHLQDQPNPSNVTLVPKAPPTPVRLLEAKMKATARKAVLESGGLITAIELAQAAGLGLTDISTQLNRWKRVRQIFAINHQGREYFPAYGLDGEGQPLKGLAEVLEVFGRRKDGWHLAYWFAAVNSFLGGQRPQDVLQISPTRVVAAAQDEMESVLHG